MQPALVSIHGGHSGEYCSHAADHLEDIVCEYIEQGFAWVGLTEHIPPAADRFLYPDEKKAGLTASAMAGRFGRYVAEARRLQTAYSDRIRLYIGFETEFYTGCLEHIKALLRQYRPDYFVGSVHHVEDIPIDLDKDTYHKALSACGGTEALYCRYFDLQYELIQSLRPAVLGHFDLIRIFDPEYGRHLQLPSVVGRIERNLNLAASLGLILDFNMAALRKGASEPYIARPILDRARELGVAVVPGDDSHGVATVGAFIQEGIALLQEMGFDTDWRTPAAP
ncbi:MAG: histidinol-phosphatase [Desulfosarcinaceae bacterium]